MRRAVLFLAPRWLALHVVVLAAGVTMVLLGRWQWHVAHVRHGDIQNYAYAFQWWAFTGFTLAMWIRVMHDAMRGRATNVAAAEPAPTADEPVAYRHYVVPSNRPATADPELAAYNRYLADLARDGARDGGRDGPDADREDAR
jgi:DNA-binding transcriptional regulator of glucitol operon